MAKIKQLVHDNKYIYPVTLSSAIKDVSSPQVISLEKRLSNIEAAIAKEAEKVNLRIDSLDVPYEDEYLTFLLIGQADGEKLYFVNEGMDTPVTIEVSTDKINWTSVTAGTSSLDESCYFATLDKPYLKIYVKANGGLALDATECYHRFGCTGNNVKLRVSGNIASLIKSDLFKSHIKVHNCKFCRLFDHMTTLIDASNLILDDIEIYTECFKGMFSGCTNLVQGPDLNSTELLTYDSHADMFRDCISLLYIKCLVETVTQDPFTNWVAITESSTDDIGDYRGVNGTFIVSDNSTGWEHGRNGVPSGWIIVPESDYLLVRRYQLDTPGTDIQDLYFRLSKVENLVNAMAAQQQVEYSGVVLPTVTNPVLIVCRDLGSDGGKLNGQQSFNIPLGGFVSNGINTYNIDFTTDITYDILNAKIYNASGHYDNDNNIVAFNSAKNLTPNADSTSIYYKMPVLTFIPNQLTDTFKFRNDCVLVIPMTYTGHGTTLSLEARIPLYLVAS